MAIQYPANIETRMLMETEITLEYGKNLKEHKVVHKEMLCCHSNGLVNQFKKAESLREAYATSDRLRKYLKDFVHPRLSHEDFEELHREKQVRGHGHCIPIAIPARRT